MKYHTPSTRLRGIYLNPSQLFVAYTVQRCNVVASTFKFILKVSMWDLTMTTAHSMHTVHKDSITIWKTITKQDSFFLNKYNQHIKHRFISTCFQSRSVIINRVCLESPNGLHAVSRAQEPWEGVFGHQTVDPLLCLVECVCTQRVHHTQQVLPGLSVQVYLRGKHRLWL